MRKICSILTVLAMVALCLFLLPTESQAAEIPGSGTCGEGFTFTYVNGLLMVYGSGSMPDFSYTNKAPWDVADSPIKEIVIKEGITSIGNFAFSSCYQLEKLYLPTTLTSIGESAFTGCNLNSLVLPDNVESIGASAFAYCGNLSSVTLNANLKTIGQSAFYSCPILKTITIPASVTSIETSAFSSCTSLTKIQVDQNNAAYTSDASGVLFDKGMTTLMQMPGSFSGAYTIPNSVTTISDRAFYTCAGLTALSIPDSLTTIGDSAFKYCSKLSYQEYGNANYLGNAQNPYMVLVSATT